MRHFPRLNRVAYGILGQRHPTVLTLLEQNERIKLRPRQVSREIPAAERRRPSCASGRTSLRAATGKGVAQILCHSRWHRLEIAGAGIEPAYTPGNPAASRRSATLQVSLYHIKSDRSF